MFTKLVAVSVLSLGLVAAAIGGARTQVEDCCSLGLACCQVGADCCLTEVQPECCEIGLTCCEEVSDCCVTDACCVVDDDCCEANTACCEQEAQESN